MKLLTIADGFGDSKAVPAWYPDYIKWPEIIKLMTRGLTLTNMSRYGAGNEYIMMLLKHHAHNHDAVLIQWAMPERLDLVLDHSELHAEFWKQQIANDAVYCNNIVDLANDQIWISSASRASAVQEYHSKFITSRQHQLRSQMFVDHAKLLLQQQPYGFLLTKNSQYLKSTADNLNRWHWHEPFGGMCEFRQASDYADLDLGLFQPIPLIHFDFVRKFIQPQFDLPWRNERDIQGVKDMLYRKYKESTKNQPQ
jgi:hypothetical protein